MLSPTQAAWTLLAGLVLLFLWRRIMKPFEHFAKRGVAFRKPLPIFGNFGKLMLKQESMYDLVVNSYNEFKHKRFYGLYDFSRPLLAIRDPDLIRQITVKDFEYFLDHRPFLPDGVMEPLFAKSLFVLTGQKWRDMRSTLSPAFTGSKMRQMFQLVVDCCEQSTKILLAEAKASRQPYVPEMKDLFTRFTNDVIATSAFGISVNSLQNRSNEFYRIGRESTSFGSLAMSLKMTLMLMLPKLAKAMDLKIFGNRARQFYHSLVHDTIKHREKEGIVRPDMIHLLMEARKGQLKTEPGTLASKGDDAGFATVEEVRPDSLQGEQKVKWDDDDLTAQCFLFFIAGFDTSSTLLCFAAHELMENPLVQRRLIEELDEAKDQLAGKPLTYDALQKLQYLDMVVSETLRKWPPGLVLDRQCQKPYTLTDESGHTVTLQKGDGIWIPAVAIHRDAQYYANPELFDPERFSEERKGEIQPFTYMPFGLGPRNCIGSRFALMECKSFLFYLLTNFTFEVAATSTIPLVLAPKAFAVEPKGGFNVHLKPRF